MADADLRRLQRTWESSPDDIDIATEYIRELQRASLGVSEETGRVRDFRVGVAPPIELDISGNAQDRLLWDRLTHFAEFMNPMAQPNRMIVPVNEEVLGAMQGPGGPLVPGLQARYERPRYRHWHRARQDIEEAHAKGYRYVAFRRISPTRESGDVAMRRMQRRAITGDPRAQQQYERMRERRGLPPERRNPIKTHRTTNGYKIYAAEWGEPASFTWRGSIKPRKPFSWLLMDTAGEVVHISNADENGATYQDALDLAEEYSQELPSQYFIASGKPKDEYPYEFTPKGHGVYITEWGAPSLQWAQWLGPRPEKSFYWIIRDLGGRELASSTKKTAGVDVMDAWYKALDVEKRLPSSL